MVLLIIADQQPRPPGPPKKRYEPHEPPLLAGVKLLV
jgi:hypothetical protein